MLRIGVLSDTHLGHPGQGMAFLHDLAVRCFDSVDLILHAGDVGDPSVLAALTDVPVYAVKGNTDPVDSALPLKQIVVAGGAKIGLIHGWGSVDGLETRVRREFSDTGIECLVYGHSHQPVCHRHHGVLFFNPGSPTDRRSAPFHSIGILEVETEITGRIIRLDEETLGAFRSARGRGG
ncbi:MAG TPA: metallophosphoesterase family protein [Desulfuromonadales bacterium]|nr:metallophosphoesterase family protein [Desulfuromonadales bacterium]